MTYQAVRFFKRVDIRHAVPVPAEEAAPANALRERDTDLILDRAGNFIQTRA
jgi:hypothetical protein